MVVPSRLEQGAGSGGGGGGEQVRLDKEAKNTTKKYDIN